MNILEEANNIVNGNRDSDYGSSKESFKRISSLASLITNKELTDIDCAKVLIAVKLVRESYKHKEDNLVDACGYLKILNDLYEPIIS